MKSTTGKVEVVYRHCQENHPSRDAMGLDMKTTDFGNKLVKANTQCQPAWECEKERPRAPAGSLRLFHPLQ